MEYKFVKRKVRKTSRFEIVGTMVSDYGFKQECVLYSSEYVIDVDLELWNLYRLTDSEKMKYFERTSCNGFMCDGDVIDIPTPSVSMRVVRKTAAYIVVSQAQNGTENEIRFESVVQLVKYIKTRVSLYNNYISYTQQSDKDCIGAEVHNSNMVDLIDEICHDLGLSNVTVKPNDVYDFVVNEDVTFELSRDSNNTLTLVTRFSLSDKPRVNALSDLYRKMEQTKFDVDTLRRLSLMHELNNVYMVGSVNDKQVVVPYDREAYKDHKAENKTFIWNPDQGIGRVCTVEFSGIHMKNIKLTVTIVLTGGVVFTEYENTFKGEDSQVEFDKVCSDILIG